MVNTYKKEFTMLTFKDFLEESRSAPLYHGTTYTNLRNILDGDFLKASDGYVSLSRSLNFAHYWASDKSREPVVIQFDQRKLTHRFRMEPYNYHSDPDRLFRTRNAPIQQRGIARAYDDRHHTNEFEEAVKGDMRRFRHMITHIYVQDRTTADKLKQFIGLIEEDEGIELEIKIVVGFKRVK